MNNIKKSLMVASLGLTVFAFVAADCTGEGIEVPCADSTECEGDDICHPTELVCVDNCAVSGDLCGPGEVCNEEDADGVRPIDDADFNSICACVDNEGCDVGFICDADRRCVEGCEVDADCADGETCNEDTNLCAAGCAVDADCPEGEICNVDTAACQAPVETCLDDNGDPDDLACLGTNELCDGATEDCVAPDDLIGGCAEAAALDARDGSGPVLYNLIVTVGDDGVCQAGQTQWDLEADLFDADLDLWLETSGNADRSGASNFRYSRDGVETLAAFSEVVYVDVDAGRDAFIATTLCFDNAPAGIAVQVNDQAGNNSNAGCVAP